MGRVEGIYQAKLAEVQSKVDAKLSSVGIESVDFASILGMAKQSASDENEKYTLRAYTGTELKPYTNENTYNDLISEKAEEYDVDADLVKAIVRKESNFLKKAKSYKDARGLMQLMPGTARDMGVTDRFDPEQSIDGGTKFIKMMLDRFDDERLAVAAYFSGPNRVASYNITDPDDQSQYNRLSEKTREYVDKVLGYRDVYAKY